MREVAGMTPTSSKTLASEEEVEFDGGIEDDGSEQFIQDQIIITPEIMRKILGYLNVQSLERVRLVCKSWLLEAQFHMEKRGIIPLRIRRNCGSTMIQSLLETLKSKIQSLPTPLKAVNVLLTSEMVSDSPVIISQLLSLPPPLEITRFHSSTLPLRIFLPLIIKISSTLEYLQLSAFCIYEGRIVLPTKDHKQEVFPKLRHLDVNVEEDFTSTHLASFPSVVAWIANSSPNLETFQLKTWDQINVNLISEIFTQVVLKNVKNFKFLGCLDPEHVCTKRLMSIPFSQLRTLKLTLPYSGAWGEEALVALVTRSALTLRELDLSEFEVIGETEFPVLPNVRKLHLSKLSGLKSLMSFHFPSLRVLNIRFDYRPANIDFNDILPWSTVESLDVRFDEREDLNEKTLPKFFDKFPSLERLGVDEASLIFCCSLKATGRPEFSSLFNGLKHVEIHKRRSQHSPGFSSLAVLKGLESVTIKTSFDYLKITSVPVKELPCLKVIQFSWYDSLNKEELLEMTKGVEKVRITNCCYVFRSGASGLKSRLKKFFEGAPNAECMKNPGGICGGLVALDNCRNI